MPTEPTSGVIDRLTKHSAVGTREIDEFEPTALVHFRLERREREVRLRISPADLVDEEESAATEP